MWYNRWGWSAVCSPWCTAGRCCGNLSATAVWRTWMLCQRTTGKKKQNTWTEGSQIMTAAVDVNNWKRSCTCWCLWMRGPTLLSLSRKRLKIQHYLDRWLCEKPVKGQDVEAGGVCILPLEQLAFDGSRKGCERPQDQRLTLGTLPGYCPSVLGSWYFFAHVWQISQSSYHLFGKERQARPSYS